MFFFDFVGANQQLGSWVTQRTPVWVTANGISWSRLIAGALMLPALAVGQWLVLFLYVYACFSDWWDGQVARNRKQAGDPAWGKRLDELADKGLMLLSLPVFAYSDTAPIYGVVFWGVVSIVMRDVAITYLRSRDRDWATQQPVLGTAKAKTALLMVGSALVLSATSLLVEVGGWLIMASTLCALVSGAQYLWSFLRR